MAQNDTRSLVLSLVDEVERLKSTEELLNIAMDQLDRDNEKTVTRLILLVEVVASHLNSSIDEVSHSLRRLRQTPAFKQSDKL